MTKEGSALSTFESIRINLFNLYTQNHFSASQWSILAEKAAHDGVAPILYKYLEDCGQLIPRKVWETWREIYLHNALRNSTIRQELCAMLQAFEITGISVIVLKGAHLAEFVYGDPALRPMADLDLLVRERDLPRAEQCLVELGYGPAGGDDRLDPLDYAGHHHLRPFVKLGAVPVEIHRRLTAGSDFLNISADRLWERASCTVIAGVSAKVLSPEDLLLHLCLHTACNHSFEVPFLHLCDIAWAVERYRQEIDWRRVAALAEEWGLGRLVYSTLVLVEETLGCGIEPAKLDAFRHEATDAGIVATLREFVLAPRRELPATWQELGECTGLRDRARTLARGLFPERRRMCKIYGLTAGARSVPFYYLFRPIDLLVRRGRIMLELIFRVKRVRPDLEREEKRLRIRSWLHGCVGAGRRRSRTGL